MPFLAAIVVVLIMIGNIKMVAPEDHWIRCLMSSLSFPDGGEVSDVVKTMSRMIGALQQARLAGAATQGDFLGGVFWAPSLDFRGKNLRSGLHWLYLAMTDYLVEGIVWNLFELSSGENS